VAVAENREGVGVATLDQCDQILVRESVQRLGWEAQPIRAAVEAPVRELLGDRTTYAR
jgi:hypothetical protein